ncbi:hypothetical protein Acid345_3699 [Candidatus Koribacter versatilis Ellin345]|uniref:Uncharacterized protein n=1 Tax=Koribacter versatilis (strain Ellin345) TaxID=204669 RepID=Q1IKA0_KORVE|nr:hypothetical protein [Candidatus Koribacter versatilis]ABF42700.1 hypothetical protein Acid345_3699 [Candidatus Koribacter versatilis Ellin345]
MAETRWEAGTDTKVPLVFRPRLLRSLGWTLLLLALVMLSFHVLWMWNRLGRGAWLVAIGLGMDALVGLGLIWAGNRAKRNQ